MDPIMGLEDWLHRLNQGKEIRRTHEVLCSPIVLGESRHNDPGPRGSEWFTARFGLRGPERFKTGWRMYVTNLNENEVV